MITLGPISPRIEDGGGGSSRLSSGGKCPGRISNGSGIFSLASSIGVLFVSGVELGGYGFMSRLHHRSCINTTIHIAAKPLVV
jgi:hypothetical protein